MGISEYHIIPQYIIHHTHIYIYTLHLSSCFSLLVFDIHAHRSNLFELAVQQFRLQVRLVFALFGGVGAVRFVVDSTGQRMAYVELKNRENMAKAGVAFSFLGM